jgi:hypothetical protein
MPATLTGIAANCATAPADPDTVKRAIHDTSLSEIQGTLPLPSETATAASESISSYDAILRLTEDLTARLLYHPDVLPYQNIYRILRDLLQRFQVTIQSTSLNERISPKVARTLYHSHERICSLLWTRFQFRAAWNHGTITSNPGLAESKSNLPC